MMLATELLQGMPQGAPGRTRTSSTRAGRVRTGSERAAQESGPAAVYCRASTTGQANHGHGLPAQEEACRRFCEGQGILVVGVYADTVSGAEVDEDTLEVPRPELMRLLREAPAHGVRLIVMNESSRLARDDLARALLRRMILKAGLDVRSVTEPTFTLRKTRPADALLNGVLAAVSEYERLAIALRTSAGRLQKAAKGGYSGGGPAYGYQATRGTGTLTVNEEEARLVRRIFAWHRQGLSVYRIEARLRAAGSTTREGCAWRGRQIYRIISRRAFYQGRRYRYGGTENLSRIPAIL